MKKMLLTFAIVLVIFLAHSSVLAASIELKNTSTATKSVTLYWVTHNLHNPFEPAPIAAAELKPGGSFVLRWDWPVGSYCAIWSIVWPKDGMLWFSGSHFSHCCDVQEPDKLVVIDDTNDPCVVKNLSPSRPLVLDLGELEQ